MPDLWVYGKYSGSNNRAEPEEKWAATEPLDKLETFGAALQHCLQASGPCRHLAFLASARFPKPEKLIILEHVEVSLLVLHVKVDSW